MQKIFVLLFILFSIVPLFYINKWLQNLIIPRKSFGRLVLYFLVVLELIVIYTFLLVMGAANLFPLQNR